MMSAVRWVGYCTTLLGFGGIVVEILTVFWKKPDGVLMPPGFGLVVLAVGLIAIAVDDIRKAQS